MGTYPFPAYHFSVEWGGQRTGFTEVSGLAVEHSIIEYREGSSPENAAIIMPGQRKHGTVTLKRGIVKGDNDFYAWINTIKGSTVERRDVIIKLLNENHEPVMVWKLHNAWPSKVAAETLKAEGNEVAVETMEIVYESISIEAV